LELFKGLITRRSIHKFKPNAVPQKLVDRIIEAARWAPSGGNAQPWKFIIIYDPVLREQLAQLFTWGKHLGSAPLAIAVVVDPKETNYVVEDGSVATHNILLASHGIGLGGCWIAINENEEAAKSLLGIPHDQKLVSLVAIGYPDEKPSKTRKDAAEIIFTDKYEHG
jgi:nitroreductase